MDPQVLGASGPGLCSGSRNHENVRRSVSPGFVRRRGLRQDSGREARRRTARAAGLAPQPRAVTCRRPRPAGPAPRRRPRPAPRAGPRVTSVQAGNQDGCALVEVTFVWGGIGAGVPPETRLAAGFAVTAVTVPGQRGPCAGPTPGPRGPPLLPLAGLGSSPPPFPSAAPTSESVPVLRRRPGAGPRDECRRTSGHAGKRGWGRGKAGSLTRGARGLAFQREAACGAP